MDYVSSKRRRRTIVSSCNDNLKELYPLDINLYTVPPVNEILLSEFQEYGVERMKVLKSVDTLNVRNDLTSLDAKREALIASLRKDNLNHYIKLLKSQGSTDATDTDLLARRRDHISHFILRLAYCHNTKNVKWFVTQEVELFRLRFSALNKDGITELMSLSNFGYVPISQEEKEELHEELLSSLKVNKLDNINFYKIPFQKLTATLRARKGYLRGGLLYVPQTELMSLFVSQFRKSLLIGLKEAELYFYNIIDDERLNKFLTKLPNCFAGMNRVVWGSSITSTEMLDDLSKTSFPLCMRMLHEALRTNHHLKHQGRLVYLLFIKGIGVTLDDALQFWQSEFTKSIDLDRYEKKQYAYGVRHTYGQEGCRKNYTPFGCVNIINSSAGVGDYHGCPYKNLNAEVLRARLTGYGFHPAGISEIVQLATDRKYTLACMKYFEITHKCFPESDINHPNAYFQMSRNILTKNSGDEVSTPGTPMNAHSSHAEPGTSAKDTPRAIKETAQSFRGTPKSARNTTPQAIRGTPRSLSVKLEGNDATPAKRAALQKSVNIEELLNQEDDYDDEFLSEVS